MKNVVLFSDDTELRDWVRQLDGYQVLYFSTELDPDNLPEKIDLAIFDFDVVPLSLLDEWSQFPRLHIRKMTVVSAENLLLIDDVLEQLDNYIVRPLSSKRLLSCLESTIEMNFEGTLFGLLGFELQAPLNSINGYTKVIQSKKFSLDDETEFLETIGHISDRLLITVRTLKDWVRSEYVRYYFFEQMKLSDLLESKYIATQIRKIPQNCTLSAPRDLPKIIVDEYKILFVINALLKNASQYSNDASEIRIIVQRDNDNVSFSITDQGIGISQDDENRIFEKFYRHSEVKSYGMGLDLYLCKQIIEMHGGKIWFESEVGVGTTFYFTLPLAE